jgi:hypothetical protein
MEADVDGSGEVDFQEFLYVLASVRRGNSGLHGFAAMTVTMNETPVLALEIECEKRGLVRRS